jgi:hypothetical protein
VDGLAKGRRFFFSGTGVKVELPLIVHIISQCFRSIGHAVGIDGRIVLKWIIKK